LTSGNSPLGIALARQVLAHGDYVVAGLIPGDIEKDEDRSAEFREFLQDVGQNGDPGEGWRERMRVAGLDIRCASHGKICDHWIKRLDQMRSTGSGQSGSRVAFERPCK